MNSLLPGSQKRWSLKPSVMSTNLTLSVLKLATASEIWSLSLLVRSLILLRSSLLSGTRFLPLSGLISSQLTVKLASLHQSESGLSTLKKRA